MEDSQKQVSCGDWTRHELMLDWKRTDKKGLLYVQRPQAPRILSSVKWTLLVELEK